MFNLKNQLPPYSPNARWFKFVYEKQGSSMNIVDGDLPFVNSVYDVDVVGMCLLGSGTITQAFLTNAIVYDAFLTVEKDAIISAAEQHRSFTVNTVNSSRRVLVAYEQDADRMHSQLAFSGTASSQPDRVVLYVLAECFDPDKHYIA